MSDTAYIAIVVAGLGSAVVAIIRQSRRRGER
jgi:hypothetical protein